MSSSTQFTEPSDSEATSESETPSVSKDGQGSESSTDLGLDAPGTNADVSETESVELDNPTPYLPEYIFGLHESGGEHHMVEAERCGWILELAAVGLDADGGRSADYRKLAEQKLGVVVRAWTMAMLRWEPSPRRSNTKRSPNPVGSSWHARVAATSGSSATSQTTPLSGLKASQSTRGTMRKHTNFAARPSAGSPAMPMIWCWWQAPRRGTRS